MKFMMWLWLCILIILSMFNGLNKDDISNVLNKELSPEINEIYERISEIHGDLIDLEEDYTIVMHYLRGHDGFIMGCPECGLLNELKVRKEQMYVKMIELASQRDATNSEEIKKEITNEIDELIIEEGLISKHLYSSKKIKEEVSKATNKNGR